MAIGFFCHALVLVLAITTLITVDIDSRVNTLVPDIVGLTIKIMHPALRTRRIGAATGI